MWSRRQITADQACLTAAKQKMNELQQELQHNPLDPALVDQEARARTDFVTLKLRELLDIKEKTRMIGYSWVIVAQSSTTVL